MQPATPESQRRKRRIPWFALATALVFLVALAIWLRGLTQVRIAAPGSKAVTEISQLAFAVQVFQRDKKVDSIPSQIVLRERMDYNLNDPLEAESLNNLKRIWPQIPFRASGSSIPPGKELDKGIDWNGNGEIDGDGVASPAVILEGDQCLVFFLGGFSNHPLNPAALPRRSPAFEFPASRLKDVHGNGFPSFIDVWGEQPYAYFSSRGPGGYSDADCRTITGLDFALYRSELGAFLQPKGFQIICAGPDKKFGHGGILKAGSFTKSSDDGDNLTNFSNGRLSDFGR